MPAIRNLVERIVDYAGLFPPAALPLDQVTHNYAKYLQSEFSWMLGRLVLPAGKLAEFSELARPHLPAGPAAAWMISGLLPPIENPETFETGVEQILAFNQRHQSPDAGYALVDSIETKATSVDQIHQIAEQLPDELIAFLELPHAEDPGDLIEAIHLHPREMFAKIRTGGVTRDLIPPAAQVARFIHRCARHHVGFKATAGLHHPLRGKFRLTYEDQAEQGTMYGFLNVFAAACFAFGADASQSDLTAILKETDINQFQFSDLTLAWKNMDVTAGRIAEIRLTKATSFGSCSFDEPTRELAELQSISVTS